MLLKSNVVTCYIGSDYNMTTPEITKTADVTTSGLTGKASFELSTTDTNIPSGRYYIQVDWALDGTSRNFTVYSGVVDVVNSIK